MACTIVYNNKEYSEEDFRMYLRDRGITEDMLTREKELIDKAVSYAPSIKGVYKGIIEQNPREALFEIAAQANSSASEKSGAISAVGQKIVDVAQQLFPNAKAGSPYLQEDNTTNPISASPKAIAKFKSFLDQIDVKLEEGLSAIVHNGKKLNATGAYFASKGLIQILDGKTDVALPEESMHAAVDIIQQTNPQLFRDLLTDINKYDELGEVEDLYKNNKLYQTADGAPDRMKLKKEAIARVLAKIVTNTFNGEDKAENVAKLSKTRSLWQRIKDFLKKLFSKATDPFKEVSDSVTTGKFKGSINSLKENKAEYLQKNAGAVEYTLKGLATLSKNLDRVLKLEKQIKDPEVLFKKLQSDFQIPKDQLALLKQRYNGNIEEAMTSMAADLSYTIKVENTNGPVHNKPLPIDFDPMEQAEEVYNGRGMSGTYYKDLSVPGGVNYEENDIRTPQIIPLTKSHAEFATDNSIGWFRSDTLEGEHIIDQDKLGKNRNIANASDDPFAFMDVNNGTIIGKTNSKTRRILELQSDLFQKERDKSDLVGKDMLTNKDVPGLRGTASLEQYLQGYEHHLELEGHSEDEIARLVGEEREKLEKPVQDTSQNDFLQLLNKDGNWVGFFIKTVMQDSLNKGYEKVRFPAGDTAAKVEGHSTIADRLEHVNRNIGLINEQIASVKNGEPFTYYDHDSDYYYTYKDGILTEGHAEQGDNPNTDQSKLQEARNLQISDLEKHLESLTKEKSDLKSNGLEKIAPIAHFYEVRVKNTLEKTYGKNSIMRVTDEYGNDWFELDTNAGRDSEIYLQANAEDLRKNIEDISKTVTKSGSEYRVNGQLTDKSADKAVDGFLKYKYKSQSEFLKAREDFRVASEDKVLNEFTNIASKYIGDDGKLRTDYIDKALISVIDPYDDSMLQTLDSWFLPKLESFPEGTTFVMDKNIYDSHTSTAGHIDFLAVTPDGKAYLNQFKLLTIGKSKKDISQVVQAAYNIELNTLKNILSKAYGIGDADWVETRAIPIKAVYSQDADAKFVLHDVNIGGVDVAVERDATLLPVPLRSESTGNHTLDKLIRRFRESAASLEKQPALEGHENEKITRIANLYTAVRQLQIQKNASTLLDSAKKITDNEESLFPKLDKKIKEFIPVEGNYAELNNLMSKVHESIDSLAPYADLHSIMKELYGRDHEDTKKAKVISDSANGLLEDLLELEKYARTNQLSKINKIQDSLSPEKDLGFIARNLRTLSEGQIKSLNHMWSFVEQYTNRFVRRFLPMLDDIDEMHDEIEKTGMSWDAVNKLFLAYDKDGHWTGNTIEEISPNFSKTISDYLAKGNHKDLIEAIDLDAYRAWYNDALPNYEEALETKNFGDTPEASQKLRELYLETFKNTYNIDSKTSATRANDRAYRYPKKAMWESEEYKKLKAVPAVLRLFTWWRDRVEEGYQSGMFQDRAQTKGFFASVYKTGLENFFSGDPNKYKEGLIDPFKGLKTIPDDELIGEVDPVTGNPVNKLHARFMTDLSRTVQNTDGSYYTSYHLQSQNLTRAMALWVREQVKYDLKAEFESLSRMILDTEKSKQTYKLIKKNEYGENKAYKDNVVNSKVVADYIDALIYDKRFEGDDFTMELNYGKFARGFNKAIGFKMLSEGESDIIHLSLRKTILNTGRLFSNKTLAFSFTAISSNLFGGSTNSLIRAGRYYDKKDIAAASYALPSAFFWQSGEGIVQAGLYEYFNPHSRDETNRKINKLHTDRAVKYLSSEWMFYLQRGTDEIVGRAISLAMFKNTVYENGKLTGVYQYVRDKYNWNNRYNLPVLERQALEIHVNKEIKDMIDNSPLMLTRVAKVVNGELHMPDISDNEFVKYRQQILELIKDAFGGGSPDDIALYTRNVMFLQAMMFKHWIPRLLEKRVGGLKMNVASGQMQEGNTRALISAVRHYGLGAVGAVLQQLGNNKEPLIEYMKKDYQRKKREFADQDKDFPITEGEFIDMKLKGIRSAFKELGLALGLFGIYLALKSLAKDNDKEDKVQKGIYKYSLRAIDKLQDEISFFYNPASATSILNGSIFPAMGLAVDAQKILTNSAIFAWDKVKGDQEAADKVHIMKYIRKDIPVIKEITNWEAIFWPEFAKQQGIIIQSQSGNK